MSDDDALRPVDLVARLHLAVDTMTAPLQERHAERLTCRQGCSDCCVDDLSVFAVEAELIRQNHGGLLEEAAPHPPGACAFLDEAGACRIYETRPYVCRTQGLPLRWVEADEHGRTVERRDICPLNAEGPPLESLSVESCWSLGAVETRLESLQAAAGRPGERVALRSLFRSPGSRASGD